ncbi:MAG TPA: hypothetical protein VKI65_06195 [Gemmataceae bacterium]|nr:hypothetical protein [Gemmataceae bacterium]
MSTPTSQAATSVHPTRQQLDELEALMQRMLELPVNLADEPAGGAPAAGADAEDILEDADPWPDDYPPPPAEWGAVGLERLAAELPLSTPPQVTLEPSDESLPPANEWSEAASPNQSADLESGSGQSEDWPWSGESIQTERSSPDRLAEEQWKDVATLDSSEPLPAEDIGPALSLAGGWHLPFVWLNVAFDCLTYLLGPSGRWLRGPASRALIGWLGMLLLAGAMAWVWFEWMGWTW